jgi:hypothetical protein
LYRPLKFRPLRRIPQPARIYHTLYHFLTLQKGKRPVRQARMVDLDRRLQQVGALLLNQTLPIVLWQRNDFN